jgi:hypothetical protein
MSFFEDDDKKTPPPAPVEAAEKKTIEQWAEAKGLLPENITVPARIGSREVKAPRQNPKFVQFAMAKAHRRWPEGAEVTEEDFDKAVAEAGQVAL